MSVLNLCHYTSPSSQCPSVHSCFTSVSILLCQQSFFSFVRVESPQIRQLHRYLGIAIGEKKKSRCCFGCAMADMLPLCRKSSLHFPGIIQSGGRESSIVKVRLIENQYKRRWCHFSMAVTLYNQQLFDNDKFLAKGCIFPQLGAVIKWQLGASFALSKIQKCILTPLKLTEFPPGFSAMRVVSIF